MGTFKWRSFALVPLHLFFFTLFTCNLSATSPQLTFNSLQDDIDICKIAFCGKGTCHPSLQELFGFRCDCDPGWKKMNVGPIQFPSCILPNCTISDLQCGNGPSPTSPPLPSSIPSAGNNPCILNWCGDGTCQRNGSDFRCQCNEGSANLLNDPKWTCFKKCSVGADCNGFDLGFGSPEIQSPPPQPPVNSGSSGTGFDEMLNRSRELQMLTTIMLAPIFLKWI